MRGIKSQMSSEFIIIMSVILIIALSFLFASSNKEFQVDLLRASFYAKAEAEKVSSAINSVYISGDSSSQTVILHPTLKDNSDYKIKIYPQSRVVLVNYSFGRTEKIYTSPIVTSNITGNLSSIDYNLVIKNSDGVINVAAQ